MAVITATIKKNGSHVLRNPQKLERRVRPS